ncbi:hypothetical protein MNBD_NITROSPINAE04-1234 [hydrothermal vent metagenome]|uniref:Uncharacterized protein n=1 Tax=hydrothermal vent metagenome TaxID=652676 RepID=A0A3B1BVT0_9ZZZZ
MKPNRFYVIFICLATSALFLADTPQATASQTTENPAQTQIAKTIYNQLLEIKPQITSPSGSVVAVKGGKIYIENTSGAIVEPGSVLSVSRITEEITHPVTGETLGVIKEKVAMVKTAPSDSKLIVANILSGGGEVKPGDIIGSATGKKPRVAIVYSINVQSYGLKGFTKSLARKLTAWKGVSWVPGYAVERYLYDEKISEEALSSPTLIKSLGASLKADYTVLITLREKEGAILSDITLSDVKNGSVLVSRKGLIRNLESAKATAKVSSPAAASSLQAPPESLAKAETGKSLIRKTDKATVLASFDMGVNALLSYDLDDDGVDELVVGFERMVAVFKVQGGDLTKIWEKDMGRRSQIAGLSAGDFNGDGAVEVYVNGVNEDIVSSMIFESVGSGGYQIIRENMDYLFYSGSDGKLYGQLQEPDMSLDENIYSLVWSGSGFKSSLFMKLPEDKRLSGLTFFDIDGDGVMDVAGYNYQHGLMYYSSVNNGWGNISGEYGGSNIYLTIPTDEEIILTQEFQPVIMALPGDGDYIKLLVVKNHPAIGYFVDSPTFTKSQMYILEHDGIGYFKKAETPLANGVIQGVTRYDARHPNLVIISVTESSIFGKAKSKIILMNLDRY